MNSKIKYLQTNLKNFLDHNDILYNYIWYYYQNSDGKKIPIFEKNSISKEECKEKMIKQNSNLNYYSKKPTKYFDKSINNFKEFNEEEIKSLTFSYSVFLKHIEDLYVIDIDEINIESLEDLPLFEYNLLKDNIYVKGNSKGIHIYLKIKNIPSYSNQQDIFKNFKGDLLKTNNSWEKFDKEVYYNDTLKIKEIEWEKIKVLFNFNEMNFINKNIVEESNISTIIYDFNDNISIFSDITDYESYMNNTNDIEYDEFEEIIYGISESNSDNYQSWTEICWGIFNVGIHNKWDIFKITELIHNFSKKSKKYNYNSVNLFITNSINKREDGIGLNKIKKYFRLDNDEYYKILNIINNRVRDYDIALYVKHKLGNNYACTNMKKNCWFKFENHKWNEDDGGHSILKRISEEIGEQIEKVLFKFKNKFKNEKIDFKIKKLKEQINQCEKFIDKCRNNSGKHSILEELKTLYKRDKFVDNLDINPYILCCNNGVIDFENRIFREGKPSDMCSISTCYDYISLEEIKNDEKLNKDFENLMEFFDQLFVITDIKEYVFEHLASSLIGLCKEQDFNYYIGKGSNGKSMLVKLMSMMLGQYYGIAPTSLICSKKADLGSCTSEIALLRGLRYVVMQEPSKGENINEGVMKGLTGDDPIFCNPKFKDPFDFLPMFHLIICANFTLDIKSNDNGTWRRIKVVDFLSNFKDNNDINEVFEFKKNIDLTKNFGIWKKILLAFLTEKAYILQGKVNTNEVIENATQKYRDEQDRIGLFIKNNLDLTLDKKDKINLDDLDYEFKKWYEMKYRAKKGSKELLDRLEDEYNISYNNNYIFGIKINNKENLPKSEEDIFIEEFEKSFIVNKDEKDIYYVRSTRISEWAKKKNLKIYTSKGINKILSDKYNISTDDKEYYRCKKIDGKSILCWFGIKENK